MLTEPAKKTADVKSLMPADGTLAALASTATSAYHRVAGNFWKIAHLRSHGKVVSGTSIDAIVLDYSPLHVSFGLSRSCSARVSSTGNF
jgi:hypothetical protein